MTIYPGKYALISTTYRKEFYKERRTWCIDLRVVTGIIFFDGTALSSGSTIAGEIETIFLMPHESYAYLSSRLIKEVASLHGDISAFAPAIVVKALQKKIKS